MEIVKELMDSAEPFRFYRDAYGSFSFESYANLISEEKVDPESKIIIEKPQLLSEMENSDANEDEISENFVEEDISVHADQAISMFTVDEKGDFRLYRKLFGDLREVEVIQKDQYRWIRYGIKAKYKKTQLHREFETWKRVMIREIFSKYQNYAFEKNVQSYVESGQQCFKNTLGFLCFDPRTHFPLRGEWSESKGPDETLSMQFSISLPSDTQAIRIDYPKNFE